jgi:hypothetical protein
MQLPPTDPAPLCADLLQDLPPETRAMARACNASGRAKQGKTPPHLWRVVLFYCGREKALRETAAAFPLLSAARTEASIAERWAACRPWVPAVGATRLQPNAVATLPAPGRPGPRRPCRPRPGRPGPPVSPPPRSGRGPVAVCRPSRPGAASRRKSRPLAGGAWGDHAGRPGGCLCPPSSSPSGNRRRSSAGGALPSGPGPLGTDSASLSGRGCASTPGNPAVVAPSAARRPAWGRSAALATRPAGPRSTPPAPASAAVPSGGRPAARPRRPPGCGPAGSWS